MDEKIKFGVIGGAVSLALAYALLKKKKPPVPDPPFDEGCVYNELGFCTTGDSINAGSISQISPDEYSMSNPGWFNFFMTDVSGRDITLHIPNVSTSPLRDWFLGTSARSVPHGIPYHAVITEDGKTWERISTTYENDEYILNFTPTGNTVNISFTFPWSYRTIQHSMSSRAHLPSVRVSTLGQSVQSRDIDMIELTNFNVPENQKKHLVVITRQHPCEVISSHLMEGLISYLITKPEYLDLMHWYLIPCMNPDGVYHSRGRCNFDPVLQGIDINRSWNNEPGDPSIECTVCGGCRDGFTPEAYCARNRIDEIYTNHGIDFVFDMHSLGGPSYPGYTGQCYASCNYLDIFAGLCTNRTGFSYDVRDWSNPPAGCARWYGKQLNVIASLLLEPSQWDDWITVPILRTHGECIADAAYDYFFTTATASLKPRTPWIEEDTEEGLYLRGLTNPF